MKRFEELTKEELWELRQQISLNSLYISNYKNTFGFSCQSMCHFFDGYFDYIWEMAEEKYGNDVEMNYVLCFDNEDNLWNWFNCYDDFSWVNYE